MAQQSKKQQKAAAFRARQKAKVDAISDVPEADPVEVDEEAVAPEPEGKRKRKRDDADEDAEDTDKDKSKSKDKGKSKETVEEKDKPKKTKESKQRFILFIGNLGFKTTRDAVAAHFAKELGRTPSVRLLTEKATGRAPPKSRGIAFLELSTSAELQTCLRLHHSQLGGRQINVELTAGGGGKGDTRKAKLAERNKRVGGQRERRAEREKEAGGEEAEAGIGEGKAAWEETEKDEDAPAGYKMRGGRRVKVKGKDERPAKRARNDVSGWEARGASGGSAARGRKKWEPTGANAVRVG
ncbi:hypothetical protein CcaverHIS002_0406290 [Cutaneotrichosporon cavernicola]|uniref:Nucleolar protein 12 n=1 Tax=Cutaneotrichosporon cavernicola TaxID=279322 RepID=A0AA48L4I7_9TREE|nr:uncharacterized protein CcaverHIS019_0406320 [Cutaneotrichosporon cavernicola]BEI84025.1 hypothetical protein CcaverHIS002_0406290 [Cutaneotrichosporon cavernicola]BEI91812.1 hypothetical protein CcaverHIS019_0406320 [Cutaneotrichosporon cavernicola]BEI99583.1 hypothetical protein CcaverHIS631_0406260 [Cutaneotrichosporon cavernicola]BEJ07359.1 hypothetical protein CcaverHIS641_0406280 [Cutaneotrichosporon cavernicola]